MLAGRDRLETEAFAAFRSAYPFRAEFCAPAKGWEKGSVETGVKYVRNLVFRPRLAVESWAAPVSTTASGDSRATAPPPHTFGPQGPDPGRSQRRLPPGLPARRWLLTDPMARSQTGPRDR